MPTQPVEPSRHGEDQKSSLVQTQGPEPRGHAGQRRAQGPGLPNHRHRLGSHPRHSPCAEGHLMGGSPTRRRSRNCVESLAVTNGPALVPKTTATATPHDPTDNNPWALLVGSVAPDAEGVRHGIGGVDGGGVQARAIVTNFWTMPSAIGAAGSRSRPSADWADHDPGDTALDLDQLMTERATRNPTSSTWKVGWLRRRADARQLQCSSNQPPPRSTR